MFELNGTEYTLEQVEEAALASKMSVEDYAKSTGLKPLKTEAVVVDEIAPATAESVDTELQSVDSLLGLQPETVSTGFGSENVLDEVVVTGNRLSPELQKEADKLAIDLIKKLDLKGILAVEMFLTHDDKIIVNEVAPRPHNSGHHTVESTITSQYEQYLRAIFGFPLGDTSIKLPSVMINLLGEPGHKGKVKYEGVTQSMALKGVKTHIYGKKETYPYRKMGHVTVMDKDINKAIEKANKVKQLLKVKAW